MYVLFLTVEVETNSSSPRRKPPQAEGVLRVGGVEGVRSSHEGEDTADPGAHRSFPLGSFLIGLASYWAQF